MFVGFPRPLIWRARELFGLKRSKSREDARALPGSKRRKVLPALDSKRFFGESVFFKDRTEHCIRNGGGLQASVWSLRDHK